MAPPGVGWLLVSLCAADALYLREVVVHTFNHPLAQGDSGYLYYRLGAASTGALIDAGAGVDITMVDVHTLVGGDDGSMVVDSMANRPEIWEAFGPYASGSKTGWRKLEVSVDKRGKSSSFTPVKDADALFAGANADDLGFMEFFYLSAKGWGCEGLTVIVSDAADSDETAAYTWIPDTVWPKAYAPYDGERAIYLDLDDNFTDSKKASDAFARVRLTRACDATISMTTGNGGAYSPGVNLNMHYKLVDARGRAVQPARGPPPRLYLGDRWTEDWESPHVSMDDQLTVRVYGGLWQLDRDWRHLDEIDVEVAGATSTMRDVVAWDCGGAYAGGDLPLGGVEVVYGPSTDGWELTSLHVSLETSAGGNAATAYTADFSTEWPKLFGTRDDKDQVFFDYDAGCAQESLGDPIKCTSDWYMRFALRADAEPAAPSPAPSAVPSVAPAAAPAATPAPSAGAAPTGGCAKADVPPPPPLALAVVLSLFFGILTGAAGLFVAVKYRSGTLFGRGAAAHSPYFEMSGALADPSRDVGF
ncbi:hypothetical protein M885DRAFT_586599 [Pelagophyceae sp. CCMP2097]|nr:hypothetical protein M885DRAFT_586599 [Pelagophyceae sp. CCMP2097]